MNIKELLPSSISPRIDRAAERPRHHGPDRVGRHVGDDHDKPVLYFKGKEKGLIVNKTNANNILRALRRRDRRPGSVRRSCL